MENKEIKMRYNIMARKCRTDMPTVKNRPTTSSAVADKLCSWGRFDVGDEGDPITVLA